MLLAIFEVNGNSCISIYHLFFLENWQFLNPELRGSSTADASVVQRVARWTTDREVRGSSRPTADGSVN